MSALDIIAERTKEALSIEISENSRLMLSHNSETAVCEIS